jgi:hypothetical protein
MVDRARQSASEELACLETEEENFMAAAMGLELESLMRGDSTP